MSSREFLSRPEPQVLDGSSQIRRYFRPTDTVKFKTEERGMLVGYLRLHGTKTWNSIADRIRNRDAMSFHQRHSYSRNRSLQNDTWAPEEELLLREKVAEYGTNWNTVGTFFPNKSAWALADRWRLLNRRESRGGAIALIGASNLL
jgi:hypothetical protein